MLFCGSVSGVVGFPNVKDCGHLPTLICVSERVQDLVPERLRGLGDLQGQYLGLEYSSTPRNSKAIATFKWCS